MAASLCPVYMLGMLTNYVKSSDIEDELDKIIFRFLLDKIGKQQVEPPPPRQRGCTTRLNAHAQPIAHTPRRC